MDVELTGELARFIDTAGTFLARDPVRNTVLLTVLDVLRTGSSYDDAEPWFAWATDSGEVVGAALRTPPYKVALSGMPTEVAQTLGARLAAIDLPGGFGDLATVAAFAAAADRRHRVRIQEIQYLLTEVTPPPRPTGAPRAYRNSDASTYLRWNDAFIAETGVARGGSDPIAALHNRIRAGGGLWLWEVDGDEVSMCGMTPPVAGVPRIGPVWTAPGHRRLGYAAALTAFVCTQALATGVQACTLFADAANPTSNGVYERIGFHAVGETVEADFEVV